jgi:hypothetical protein
MKKKVFNLLKLVVVILFITIPTVSYGQQITKYDYAEIIVIQKIKIKPNSEFKNIYINSTTDTNLDKNEINKIENGSKLMEYMNNHNWEFVVRNGIEPGNTAPVWFNYIFRKKKG